MATTVTYKNNTLVTVNNQTKTLKTAGKYLEDDITLVDISGGVEAVSIVDTPDAAGGTVRTVTAVDISDTTASAADVVQGKYFYTADGTKTAGTASSGEGYVSALVKRTWPSGEVTLDADVTEVNEFLFAGTPITRIHGQNVTTIRTGAFKNCKELTQITKDDFPNVTTIAANNAAEATFYGCSKLQLIHFPNLVTIPTTQWPSGSGQIGTSTLKPIIVLPKITTFPNFRSYITRFAAIDLGPNITTTSISGSSYFYEGYVDILIIRKSDAVIATAANSIRRLSSSTTMYVPQALVSSYQTASNWSAKYADGMQILAIEGSQYENYYADGTPIQTT